MEVLWAETPTGTHTSAAHVPLHGVTEALGNSQETEIPMCATVVVAVMLYRLPLATRLSVCHMKYHICRRSASRLALVRYCTPAYHKVAPIVAVELVLADLEHVRGGERKDRGA